MQLSVGSVHRVVWRVHIALLRYQLYTRVRFDPSYSSPVFAFVPKGEHPSRTERGFLALGGASRFELPAVVGDYPRDASMTEKTSFQTEISLVKAQALPDGQRKVCKIDRLPDGERCLTINSIIEPIDDGITLGRR